MTSSDYILQLVRQALDDFDSKPLKVPPWPARLPPPHPPRPPPGGLPAARHPPPRGPHPLPGQRPPGQFRDGEVGGQAADPAAPGHRVQVRHHCRDHVLPVTIRGRRIDLADHGPTAHRRPRPRPRRPGNLNRGRLPPPTRDATRPTPAIPSRSAGGWRVRSTSRLTPPSSHRPRGRTPRCRRGTAIPAAHPPECRSSSRGGRHRCGCRLDRWCGSTPSWPDRSTPSR